MVAMTICCDCEIVDERGRDDQNDSIALKSTDVVCVKM